jgi:hypothetical protein
LSAYQASIAGTEFRTFDCALGAAPLPDDEPSKIGR